MSDTSDHKMNIHPAYIYFFCREDYREGTQPNFCETFAPAIYLSSSTFSPIMAANMARRTSQCIFRSSRKMFSFPMRPRNTDQLRMSSINTEGRSFA